MPRIRDTFTRLKERGQMAFMPFITAGDPDLATTQQVIKELASAEVDLIEIGFPYSDPIADGPVIQASYTRALQHGLKVSDIFRAIGELDTTKLPPLVAMVSYAIVFRQGTEKFAKAAAQAGFSGVIIPDLPGEEAGDVAAGLRAAGLDPIPLIAPTTTPDRASHIVKDATGFIYCISVAGTTGVREALPEELRAQLESLRKQTPIPLAVGFGISRPEQVAGLKGQADGVIVGSAIVKRIGQIGEKQADPSSVLQEVREFARSMSAASHG